jgi:hypothetical protein
MSLDRIKIIAWASAILFSLLVWAAIITAGVAIAAPRPTHHQHRYWWAAVDNCTISTATGRNGAWRGTPYIVCTGSPSHWGTTPQTLNPADNVYAPPDTSLGTQPCDYTDTPCLP